MKHLGLMILTACSFNAYAEDGLARISKQTISSIKAIAPQNCTEKDKGGGYLDFVAEYRIQVTLSGGEMVTFIRKGVQGGHSSYGDQGAKSNCNDAKTYVNENGRALALTLNSIRNGDISFQFNDSGNKVACARKAIDVVFDENGVVTQQVEATYGVVCPK